MSYEGLFVRKNNALMSKIIWYSSKT